MKVTYYLFCGRLASRLFLVSKPYAKIYIETFNTAARASNIYRRAFSYQNLSFLLSLMYYTQTANTVYFF